MSFCEICRLKGQCNDGRDCFNVMEEYIGMQQEEIKGLKATISYLLNQTLELQNVVDEYELKKECENDTYWYNEE